MSIGQNIKKARKSKGMTQKDLGILLGVSQAAIGQFESENSTPKIETIQKISEALHISMRDLLSDEPLYSEKIKNFDTTVGFLADLFGYIYPLEDIYIVGRGKESFVLDSNAVSALSDSIKGSILPLVNYLKSDVSPLQILTSHEMEVYGKNIFKNESHRKAFIENVHLKLEIDKEEIDEYLRDLYNTCFYPEPYTPPTWEQILSITDSSTSKSK